MKKFTVLVFALALFGVRMVSASEISLPIGSINIVEEYLRSKVDIILVNVAAENPWTPIDYKESFVTNRDELNLQAEALLKVCLDRSKQMLDDLQAQTINISAMGIFERVGERRPWAILMSLVQCQLATDAQGKLIIPSAAYEVTLTSRGYVPVTVEGIQNAKVCYRVNGEERIVEAVLPVDKNKPGMDLVVIREDSILLLPYDLSIGTYPGTLTLSLKDGSEQVFDLQPDRMVITSLERGAEQITLTLKGSGLFAVDVSTDLKTWTEAGIGAFDPEGPTIFQVACTKSNYGFYRLRGRNSEVSGSGSR